MRLSSSIFLLLSDINAVEIVGILVDIVWGVGAVCGVWGVRAVWCVCIVEFRAAVDGTPFILLLTLLFMTDAETGLET